MFGYCLLALIWKSTLLPTCLEKNRSCLNDLLSETFWGGQLGNLHNLSNSWVTLQVTSSPSNSMILQKIGFIDYHQHQAFAEYDVALLFAFLGWTSRFEKDTPLLTRRPAPESSAHGRPPRKRMRFRDLQIQEIPEAVGVYKAWMRSLYAFAVMLFACPTVPHFGRLVCSIFARHLKVANSVPKMISNDKQDHVH